MKVQNDSYAQVDDHHFDRFNEMASEKVATQVQRRHTKHQQNELPPTSKNRFTNEKTQSGDCV